MTECQLLVDLMHKAYHGKAWHGPAVAELLSDVTAAQAAARPAAGSHSIWELALHMLAWKDEVRRSLTAPARELDPNEDWPPVADTSEGAWREARDRLAASHRALEAAASQLDAAQLAAPVIGTSRPVEEMLHSIVHHDLYHAGQIALLKTGLGNLSFQA
ncbi:MAG: DinB family protein [Planctomycetia bacterium]|nr:DinB family protein [Planctomycetia bacterium]